MGTSLSNNRGFTLVELMMASIITIVGLLGLAEAMNYATQMNWRTQLRDESVQIAEDWMTQFRAAPFANISSSGTPSTVYRYPPLTVKSRLRGRTLSYVVVRSALHSADRNTADLGVQVRCNFKNFSTVHEVHTVRYNMDAP